MAEATEIPLFEENLKKAYAVSFSSICIFGEHLAFICCCKLMHY